MLKKRIIGCVVVKNNWVVQSIDFKRYLPIGRPEVVVEYLNRWGIDEIVVLDIEASKEKRSPNLNLIEKLSSECLVPLTYGGGIKSVSDIRDVIRAGADKVCINSGINSDKSLITKGAEKFGDQAIVVSIDCRNMKSNWYTYDYLTDRCTQEPLPELIEDYQVRGAGELFVNAADNDGKKEGFSKDLYSIVCKASSIPIIACGGAGHPQHFFDLFESTDVSAAAAGNFFNFTEHSVILTKAYLKEKGFDVRLETYANYEQSNFDTFGRLLKKTDEQLLSLRFQHIEDEVI